MKIAKFDPNGGPIKVDIKAGFAQPGSYTLILWAADTNVRVREWPGNFINPDDDFFFLPTPLLNNDGRLLNCVATFTLASSIKDFQLEMIVSQDGNELAKDVKAGKSDELTVSVESFIKLKKK